MSRFNPHHAHAPAVYNAAEKFKIQCLVSDGSIFADDRTLWTAENIQQLQVHFSENLDEGEGGFYEKLELQLALTTPATKQLMSEMIWLVHLFPTNIGPLKKREAAIRVWSWSGERLEADHQMLSDDVLGGLGSGGRGLLSFRWRELRYVIQIAGALKSIEQAQRAQLCNDGWAFSTWLDGFSEEGNRQLRNILPHLLFPDNFERISVSSDKDKILIRLGKFPANEVKALGGTEKDHRLLELRRELEKAGGAPIDFYVDPQRSVWNPVEAPVAAETQIEEIEDLDDVVEEEQPREIDEPLNQILYGPPGTGKTHETAIRALKILDPEFLTEAAGDEKAIRQRYRELEGQGRIRFVTFHQSYGYEDFVEGIKAETRPDGSIRYHVADGVFKEFCSPLAVGANLGGYRIESSTDEILWLRKPNDAKLGLPWAVIRELRGMVDNHELSIDDFDEKIGSRYSGVHDKHLVTGHRNVFKRILQRMDSPANILPAKVFIIDEINRGNVSKIFGELITLIEPSKRAGTDTPASTVLPYSRERFVIPSNIFIIGTMNTADRSLTGLDLALRRRFHFDELEPDATKLAGIEIGGVNISDFLTAINVRIEALLDREHRLGHAYFMPLREPGATLERFQKIFRYQIVPLLQEYFFDDWQKIHWVLNDHNKQDSAHVFVAPNDASTVSGLKDVAGGLARNGWKLNFGAFDKIEAYRAVIGVE